MLKKSGIHLEVMWIKGSFFCRYNWYHWYANH